MARGQDLAVEIVKLMRSTKRDIVSVDIMKQLLRAAGSVPANIAEGHGRFSLGAYRFHLQVARGSASEISSWLDLLRRCGYITDDDDKRLYLASSSVIRLLTAKIKSFDKRLADGGTTRKYQPNEEAA